MHKILRAESVLPPFLAEPAHMRSKTRILLRTLTVTALMLGAARPLSSQEFTPPVPLLEMTGHRGVVRFLQYLPPDGRNILSLSGHSLIVWDSKSGEEVIRLADGEPIFSFAAAGDRVYVATSSSARILDTSTAEVVLEFDPQQRPRLLGPVWSPVGNLIASQERGAVNVWDSASGELLRSFGGLSTTTPYHVRWSPEGTRLAVLEFAGALKVWRVEDGEEISAFQAHDPIPGSLASRLVWSPDGSLLATYANDSLVKLWDTEEWRLVHSLENETNSTINSLSPIDIAVFSPDGRHIAVAQPSSLRVWDTGTGRQLVRWHPFPESTYRPHFGSITDVAFSPEGRCLASVGLDQTAKVWDVETGMQLLDIDIFLNYVLTVDWSWDGSQFATAGYDGRAIVWDRATGREVARFEGHQRGTVLSLDYSPDGTHIVTSGRDGSVRVWDAETGVQLYELPERVEPVSRLSPPRRPVEHVSYSPRGDRFLTISSSQSFNVLELWDHATQGGTGITLDSQVHSAAWSPDGRRIATARYSFITVWDLDNIASEPLELDADSGAEDTEYKHVSWSYDGVRLLIASNNGATVLDWASGELLHSLTLEEGAVYLEESPDGSLLLTVDGQFRGPRVQVWNAKTGSELARLETVGGRVGARFSPDGKRVVTYGSQDRAVHMWDALTGEELLTLAGQRAPFLDVAFSPNGRRLAGASRDSTTWMWDALTGDLLTILPGGGRGIVFSPDGTRIASFGDRGVKVWSVGVPFRERTLDFAHFANGTGITSGIVLVNVAPHPIRPVLHFYDQEGEPIAVRSVVDVTPDLEILEDGALSVRTAMEPLGELTISTHGRGVVVSGSVKVVSNGPIGGVLRFDLPGIGVTGVGVSPPVRDVIFPARRRGGLSTAAAIHNLGEEALGVSCRLMSGGIVLEEVAISLEVNGQEARYIEELFPRTDTSDFVGSVRCTAPGMFTGIAVELDAGNRIFTTLPVMPVSQGRGGETTLDFAHFSNGKGIISSLVFVNVSGPRRVGPFTLAGQPIRPALYFYDKRGRPIAAESVVDITGDLEVTEDGALSVQTEMEPLGELTISTHGRGEVVSGSVKVVSDGPIGGVLRFGLPGIGVAGVGASQPVRDALFPARRQEEGISTAAAVHNLGEEAMVVSCQLMKDGAVLEEEEIPLEANGQEARYIEQMFTATDTSDFVGSVRCSAPPGEGAFTGVAVDLDASNQIFTTLPVVPVPERMSQE